MQTQRGEYHVKSEAETGVMPLPAKEYQGLPATPRSWERDIEQAFSLRASGKNQLCQHLRFRLPASETNVRKQISVSFKPPSLWCFVNCSPEKLTQMNIAMWHSVLRSEMCFEKQKVILPETRICSLCHFVIWKFHLVYVLILNTMKCHYVAHICVLFFWLTFKMPIWFLWKIIKPSRARWSLGKPIREEKKKNPNMSPFILTQTLKNLPATVNSVWLLPLSPATSFSWDRWDSPESNLGPPNCSMQPRLSSAIT